MCYRFVIWMVFYGVIDSKYVYKRWFLPLTLLMKSTLYICKTVFMMAISFVYHSSFCKVSKWDSHVLGHIKECNMGNNCDMVASISPTCFDFLSHMETIIIYHGWCPCRDSGNKVCWSFTLSFLHFVVS